MPLSPDTSVQTFTVLAQGEMAQGGIQLDQEKLCCSICLDLLKDPGTIPCGHSYCMNCIKSHWDEEDQKEIHSCPQCRQTFTPRPALMKNTVLADLVEELKTRPSLSTAAPADHCYAGPGDVSCDFCTGRKLKAAKSCLQCLVSYCEQHLQPHYESPAFEKHKLVKPSKTLQDSICTHHNEVMKIFCRTDQQCICYLCSMDEHKGHYTVLASAAWTERQEDLGTSRQIIQQRIQNREKDMKLLQQEMEAINYSADKAVGDSEKIFTELTHFIEKISSDLKQQIRSQQKTEVTQVKELQEKLQQEITELRRTDAELEQLSHIEDHTQFLHNYPLVVYDIDFEESTSMHIHSVLFFKVLTAAVSESRCKLQDNLSDVWTKISLTETEVDCLQPQAKPKTRAEFLQYSCQLTLDPTTDNEWLSLSDVNRKVTRMDLVNLHPAETSVEEFFETRYLRRHFQVLSRESLTGRCYWEVEWRGREAFVAVAYKDFRRGRGGGGRVFGNNEQSWTLYCFDNGYEFRHNNIRTPISGPRSSRVGVYLDHSAGILSFCSVSETMTLLHRVQTTFSQPLYAGFAWAISWEA